MTCSVVACSKSAWFNFWQVAAALRGRHHLSTNLHPRTSCDRIEAAATNTNVTSISNTRQFQYQLRDDWAINKAGICVAGHHTFM